jgi:integrase
MEKIKNKDGRVISYREKVYVDGKAVSKCFQRKSDAVRWRNTFKLEFEKRKALGIEHIKSINFNIYTSKWLESKVNQNMAKRTIDNYKSSIKRYLDPCLKDIKLEKITYQHAQEVIQMGKENALGPSRINFNLRVLKQILNDAVKENYLVRNPLFGFKQVKQYEKSLSYWLPHQINTFLASCSNDELYPFFAFPLNTGLRRGELLGLCWDKVSFDKRQIEITRIRDRYGLKDTTKTGKIRYVPLNDSALNILIKLKSERRHSKYVFTNLDGSMVNIRHFSNRVFKKAIEKANVPEICFRNLRTTYASNFVMAGGDIFTLSKILGHTSVEMTAKKYAALHPSFLGEASKVIEFSEGSSPYLAHKRLSLV